MSRFVFPQPPPATLRLQQQQQGPSPLQTFQLLLQARQANARAQERREERARTSRREQLQLEKLELELGEKRRAQVGRTLEGEILSAPTRQVREQRTQQLEQLFPNRALEFQARQSKALTDSAAAARVSRRRLVLENHRKSMALGILRRASNLTAQGKGEEAQEVFSQYMRAVNALTEQGMLDPGELPATILSDEEIGRLQTQLNTQSDIAFSPGDFNDVLDTEHERQAVAAGHRVGSQPYMDFIHRAQKRDAAIEARRGQPRGPAVQVFTGQGVPATRGAASQLQKDVISGKDILGNLLNIEEIISDGRDVRILGWIPQTKHTIAQYAERFATGLGDPTLRVLGLTEEDHLAAFQLSSALRDLIDAYRRMVTGLAAPEAELRRIEGRLKETMSPREFRERFNEYKLRTLRALFVREQLIAEGFNQGLIDDVRALDLQMSGEKGLQGRLRAEARKIWRSTRGRTGTRAQLMNEVFKYRRSFGMDPARIFNDLFADGYGNAEEINSLARAKGFEFRIQDAPEQPTGPRAEPVVIEETIRAQAPAPEPLTDEQIREVERKVRQQAGKRRDDESKDDFQTRKARIRESLMDQARQGGGTPAAPAQPQAAPAQPAQPPTPPPEKPEPDLKGMPELTKEEQQALDVRLRREVKRRPGETLAEFLARRVVERKRLEAEARSRKGAK